MPAEPTDASAGTRLRADARRNRDQIIAASRTIFAERGTEVPMEEIARAAGVGVGTLYRRFPDRDSLIRAIAVDTFQRVVDDAQAAIRQEPDAWRALTRFLHTTTGLRLLLQLGVLSPRARAVLHDDQATQRLRQALLDILSELVAAAQDDGSLRPDVSSGDIAMILSLILRDIRGLPTDVRESAPARYLTLMLDGLQARPGTPLPGRAVTEDDLDLIRQAGSP
jgi:AcrR family transcriptional regulator